MTDAPDRAWPDSVWLEDEFGDGSDDQFQYGSWDCRHIYNYAEPYLRATPARLNAEELVKVLQEIVDDLPWLIVAMGNWDAGGPEGILRLHEIADRSLGLLGWIEGEKP